MPRPRKCRRVCHFPHTLVFAPTERDTQSPAEPIILTVDEYEALRLIDRKGLSQEQCGSQMQIARTTVQLIYTSARKKLADALVEGREIRICGGDFELCNGQTNAHTCSECFKYKIRQQYGKPKGETIMKIAVTYENGQIYQHFGHTQMFKVYEAEAGKILSSQVVDTNGSGHGALAGVLNALNADILICGGIGGGARAALDANGIKLYGGVSGDADAAVEAFLAGKLDYDPEARCTHHDHAEGHTCGHHGEGHQGCSGHSCH